MMRPGRSFIFDLIPLVFSRTDGHVSNLKLVSHRKFGQLIQRNGTFFSHLDRSVLLHAISVGGGLAAMAL